MTRRVAIAAALALGLGGAPAWAQAPGGPGIDLTQGGPIDVTATDGIEWRQADQVVIARGNARAIRGTVTVNADRLLARYRPAGGRARPAQPAANPLEAGTGNSNEIWRLEAEGRVVIRSETDTARGDRAVYDIDQAVMVMTGRDLSLTTPQQVITARDSLEYWSAKRMAVARGGALVVEPAENRRIAADTLVAYFLDDPAGAPRAQPVAAAATPGSGAVPGQGRMDRVEAFGRVEIRTPTEVVRGDRGVYNTQTGMARLLGEVRITRGENQVNGQEAIVNMRTGVARLIAAPGERVQGLIVRDAAQDQGASARPAPRPAPAPARRAPAGGRP